MRISWVYLNLALRAELLHNKLHELLFLSHWEVFSAIFFEPAKLKFANWNYLVDLDVQDEAADHKNRNLQNSIGIPKLENNNLINLGVQDEEAESHKTGRKNKITKSNWNSGAEMTSVVNQCARWRSRSPNRNYKIPLRACKDHRTQKCNFPPVFAQQITQNRNTIPWRELARMKSWVL